MAFHIISPEQGKRGNVTAGENFHLVVAHHDRDVGPMLVEEIGQAANRILAPLVAGQGDSGRNLRGQFLATAHVLGPAVLSDARALLGELLRPEKAADTGLAS